MKEKIMEKEIKINEIFNSISGEINPFHQGVYTTFLRLSGCNLKCFYCDTKFEDARYHIIASNIKNLVYNTMNLLIPYLRKTNILCITGGEPLLNYDFVLELVQTLSKNGNIKFIYVETNGTVSLTKSSILNFVADFKFDSPPSKRGFLNHLKPLDILNFPVWNQKTLSMAIEKILEMRFKKSNCPIFSISPIIITEGGKYEFLIDPKKVLEEFEKEKLEGVCLNTQIHKFLRLP